MVKAKVTCTVYLTKSINAIAKVSTTMSTDLPAENLGEILADAVNAAYKEGHDPVDYSIVVRFG